LKTEEENMEQKICFYEETNFKFTEIGDIPADWEVVRLGEVAAVTSGGSAPQGEKYFINGHNPFVRVQHIDHKSHRIVSCDLITDEAVIHYRLKKFQRGTIVFPKSGASVYLEKRAILPIDAYLVSHLCAVNAIRVDVMQQYLFYALENVKFASNKADGYPTLNLSEIKKTLIPLPPLEEQKAIAYVLSTVQEAREKTEKVIEATKELKKSLMKHLFTYGPVSLEEASRINLKETEIGEIPTDWEVVRLGEVAEIQQGRTPSRDDYDNSKGYRIIKVKDFEDSGRVGIDVQGERSFSKNFLGERYRLAKGDVLLLSAAHSPEVVGQKIGYFDLDVEAFFVAELLRVRAKGAICNPYFVFSFLCRRTTKQMIKERVKGGHLYAKDLESLLVPLPPLSVQKRIAEILQTADEKIQAEEKKKQALDNLFNSMLHMLMSGKLRAKFQTFEEGASG